MARALADEQRGADGGTFVRTSTQSIHFQGKLASEKSETNSHQNPLKNSYKTVVSNPASI
jgi:hypothetical protein